MAEQNAERTVDMRIAGDLHGRFPIHGAKRDTTIQHNVVALLDPELSGGAEVPCAAAPADGLRRGKDG